MNLYWCKTAGLYPCYEDIEHSLGQHNMMAYAEYGEAHHALMKDIFESRGGDLEKMVTAARIIGANHNVQAMIGVFHGFVHAMGMAYQSSGWANGGRAASVAIAEMSVELANAWEGINGFSATML